MVRPGSEEVVKLAKKMGFEDVVAQISSTKDEQVKIACGRIENVFDREYQVLTLHLEKDKKIISITLENPLNARVERVLTQASKAIKNLTPNKDYNGIADLSYRSELKTEEVNFDLVPKAHEALDSSGDFEIAGLINGFWESRELSTSNGVFYQDKNEFYNACFRVYKDVETSGQAVECQPTAEKLDMGSCVKKAGELAKKAEGAKKAESGVYDVIYAPLAFAGLSSLILDFASIFYIESGLSFLQDRLGEQIASEVFTLYDDPTIDSVNKRRFDEEGVKTEKNAIIDHGVFEKYILNTSFARKYKKESTGNAGLTAPRPWCGVIEGSNKSYESLISEVEKGVLITNTWYTRFQNYKTGEFSTMPRDCALLIENGELKNPLKYLRINDSFERMLKNIVSMSREREHIYWWETRTPVVAPYALIRGAQITTST